MKYIQTAAAFMICLVLSLPFYSASVFAQTTGLTNVKVTGKEGYDGVVRDEEDIFTFSARACIADGIEVNKKNIRLWGTSNSTGFEFDSCSAVGDGCSYDCSFSRSMSDYSNICPSKDDFDINLYKDDGSWLDDKDTGAVCDSKAPFIDVSIDGNDPSYYKTGSNITFILFIRDDADETGCVGIKNAVFKAAGYEKDMQINTAPNDCRFGNNVIKEQASAFGEGIVNLNVTAYDNFGQSSTKTLSFTTDSTSPEIILDSLEIKKTDNSEIDYFSPQNVKLNLIINITDRIGIDESSIISDLSKIGGSSNASPASCEQAGSSIECVYSNIEHYLNESSFSKTITVNASDSAGNLKSQQITLSKSFNLDSTAPSINGLRLADSSGNEVKDRWLGGENFSVYVYINITEKEIGIEQSSVIAGLSSLNTYDSGYSGKSPEECIQINENITECRFAVNVRTEGSGSAEKSLVFNASDLAGNKAETVLTLRNVFKKDSTAPVISGLSITDANSKEITGWIGGNSFSAYVYINITEEGIGIDQNTVYANLSELSPSETGYSNKFKELCEAVDDNITKCRFNISIKINENGTVTKNIVFKAADLAGNNATQPFSYEFKVDRTGPEFQLIRTNRSDAEGRYWVGDGTNTIIADVKEEGIGLENYNVYLDLNGILLGANTKADNCTGSSSGWICYWHNIETGAVSGSYAISSTLSSKDDAGNAANKIIKGNISIDKDKPLINNITYSPVYPTEGDTLIFSVNVSENLSGLKEVKIDVAPIRNSSDGSFFISADYSECEKQGEDYICSLKFDSIIGKHVEASLDVTAEDFAGKIAKGNISIIIYETVGDIIPDFVTSAIAKITPPKIDRKAASQIKYPVFVSVQLDYDKDKTTIAEKSVECSSPAGEASFISEKTDTPYIYFKLATGDYTDYYLDINCTLALRIIRQEKLYKLPEQENLSISLQLYDMPLGTMDENIKNKINTLDNDIKGLKDEIDDLEGVIKIHGTICAIAEMLHMINSLLQALKAALHLILMIIEKYPPTTAAACGGWESICKPLTIFHTNVEIWVWPSGLGLVPPSPAMLYMKLPCMVMYHCALCDVNTWSGLILGGLSTGIDSLSGLGGSTKTVSESTKAYGSDLKDDVYFKTTTDIKIIENKFGDLYNSWGADPIIINSEKINSEKWIWNPYKSKHYAKACLCLPAIVYNLKKERQIKCMYKNCLEHVVGAGLPSETCTKTYAERYCLYVEGAQWKKGADYAKALAKLMFSILLGLGFLLIATAFKGACADYFAAANCLKCPTPGIRNVLCGTGMVLLAINEMMNIFSSKWGFNTLYDQELKGDYCND